MKDEEPSSDDEEQELSRVDDSNTHDEEISNWTDHINESENRDDNDGDVLYG